MADKLAVHITAEDGASAVFTKVGDSAKTMGQVVESAGKQSSAGLRTLGSQIKELEGEINTVGKAMVGVGGTMTAAIAVPMAAGTKAAWGQVDAVQKATVALRAYEADASKVNQTLSELVAYARSDAGVLFQRQDLFAAAQGLKVAGAATENLTGYVQIMSRAVAVGTTNWGELTQVIQRVGMTGKLAGYDFDMLTKAGYQLDSSLRNQTITWEQLFAVLDRGIPQIGDNLNTIEGLTIRFQSALRGLGLEILKVDADTSQFIEGGLGDRLYQGLSQGADLMKSMADVAGMLGDVLAGVAGVVSGAASAFLALPDGVQTALWAMTGLGGAVLTLGGSFLLLLPRIAATKAAFDTLAGSVSAFALVGRGVSALFGPWGLAIAGVTAAVGAGLVAWGKYRQHVEETASAIKGLEEAWAETDRIIAGLPGQAAARVSLEMTAVQHAIGEFTTSARDYRRALNDILSAPDEQQAQRLGESITAMLDSEIGGAFLSWAERNKDTIGEELYGALLNREHLDIYAQDVLAAWDDFLGEIEMSVTERTALETTMQEFWQRVFEPGTNSRAAIEAYQLLMAEFRRTGDVDAFGESIEGLNEKLDAGKFSIENYGDALSRALDKIDAAYGRTDDILADLDARIAERMERIQDFTSKILELQGVDEPFQKWNLTSRASEFSQLAENIRQTGDAIDGAFRIIVGNTDAIKSQADGVQKWADELINVRGELGRIDELVEKGLISGQSGVFGDGSQYAAAQDAYDSIAASVERIHDNLDAVQAIQAPLMASMLESQAAYTEELRQMPAQQQMIALGWMDSATAAKALEINTLAASLANKQLGESGEIAFQNLIDNIVRTDPFLASMLEDMQLLDNVVRDQDGRIISYDIDLRGAKGANSEILELTKSIDALTLALGGVPPEHNLDITVTGAETVQAAADDLKEVTLADGTVVKVKTEVDTDDWDNLTAAELAERFENDPVQLPVEATVKPMDGVTPEEWNSMLGPFPEIELPATIELVGQSGATAGGLLSGIAGGALQQLRDGLGWKVSVDADTSEAESKVASLQGVVEATDVAITVSTPGAIPSLVQLTAVKAAVEAVPDEAHIDVAALYWDTVIGDLGKVKGAADDIPDDVTIAVGTIGAEGAIGTLHAVANAANAIPTSITSTITTNLVTNRISNSRHGGIPGYAHGGVIAELAEAGPELLHFAGGGVAPVFTRGLYDVPPGTYVSPANANTNISHGPSIHVDFSGATFVGTSRAEMDAWAEESLVPNLRKVIQDERAGMVS